jgi:hypothetical protein
VPVNRHTLNYPFSFLFPYTTPGPTVARIQTRVERVAADASRYGCHKRSVCSTFVVGTDRPSSIVADALNRLLCFDWPMTSAVSCLGLFSALDTGHRSMLLAKFGHRRSSPIPRWTYVTSLTHTHHHHHPSPLVRLSCGQNQSHSDWSKRHARTHTHTQRDVSGPFRLALACFPVCIPSGPYVWYWCLEVYLSGSSSSGILL